MNLTSKIEEGPEGPSFCQENSKTNFLNHSFYDDADKFSKIVKAKAINLISDSIKHSGFPKEMLKTLFEGKQTRSHFIFSIGSSLDTDFERMVNLAVAMELLHEASLVHDDVQDGQKYRRNIPTVWFKYSVSEAISWGDFLLSLTFEPLLLDSIHCRSDVININLTLRKMLEGQNKEQTTKGKKIDLKDYIEIVNLKTGSLLELPILFLFSPDSPQFTVLKKACSSLGMAYQVRNDLNDFLKGVDGVDYLNKISSLPFIKLYDERKKHQLNYLFENIFNSPILEEELKSISLECHKMIQQNITYFNSIFKDLIKPQCYDFLTKCLDKYFVGKLIQ